MKLERNPRNLQRVILGIWGFFLVFWFLNLLGCIEMFLLFDGETGPRVAFTELGKSYRE